jgi:hypothetical protein
MMAAVAVLALALAVLVQSVRLHQALIREQLLRAEAELQRARAEAKYGEVMAVLKRQRHAPPAAPTR